MTILIRQDTLFVHGLMDTAFFIIDTRLSKFGWDGYGKCERTVSIG